MISKFLLGEEQTRGKLCKFAGEAADRVEAIFDIEKEKERRGGSWRQTTRGGASLRSKFQKPVSPSFPTVGEHAWVRRSGQNIATPFSLRIITSLSLSLSLSRKSRSQLMSDQKTRATRSRISRLCSLAFDRPSLLDRVRRDLGTVFCIAGSKSVAADQNRAITFRPVRPRCKLWLDRVRRGNTVSSGFEREYLLRILPSILGNAVATPNPPSYLSIRSPFPSVPRNAYSETDHFPRLSRPLFSTISRTMVFFTLEQKKGKNSDRGGSSLGGEKEG